MSPQKLFKAAGLIVLALMAQISFAQDRVITGKVTDSKDGSPLQGATVAAKGSGSGAQTGSDGTFRISVPSTVNALIVSSVGFATKEVSIEGKNSIEVALVITNTSMDEVVVVSYGTRRKSDLTGSVTSVSAKDFQKGNINSPEQLLQGKVAGLQITTGGGSAGGGSRIRIRGGASLNASNDPLIVIDGVPVEGNGIAGSANVLNSINPNDIESISVLKDASATALYGSRASNGVLIVTTKKGVKGKLRFNYNNLFSVGTVGKTVEVLTAGQVTDIINSDAAETGNNTYKNLLGTSNTNWQDEIYQSAFGIDNTISVSGGLGNVPFRASLGYLNQDGILKTNNFNRFSTALNLSPKLFENHLAVNLSVKASQTKNTFANEGAIGSSIAFDPTKPVLSGNKEWGGYYEWLQANNLPIDLSTRNPLGLLNLRDNTSKVGRVIGNVDLDYKLLFIMNGNTANCDSANSYRIQFCHRGNSTGSSNLEFNIQQLTGCLPCLEFIGNGPAGMMRCHAHFVLEGNYIHLYYHAIYFIRQVISFSFKITVIFYNRVNTLKKLFFFFRASESQVPQQLQ